MGLFAQAISRLGYALAVVDPASANESGLFTQRLIEFAGEEIQRGVSWELFSKELYRPIMARASRAANKFAIDEAASRQTEFDLEWIDGTTSYRRKYDGLASAEIAKGASRGERGNRGGKKRSTSWARRAVMCVLRCVGAVWCALGSLE